MTFRAVRLEVLAVATRVVDVGCNRKMCRVAAQLVEADVIDRLVVGHLTIVMEDPRNTVGESNRDAVVGLAVSMTASGLEPQPTSVGLTDRNVAPPVVAVQVGDVDGAVDGQRHGVRLEHHIHGSVTAMLA